MNKILALLLAVSAVASTARADVIVWSQKVTYTKTGASTKVKTVNTGYLVMDADTHALTFLSVGAGRFVVQVPDKYSVKTVNTAPFQQSTVIFVGSVGQGGIVARGVNRETTVNQKWPFPSRFVVGGSGVFTEGEETYIQDFKGSLTYDSGKSNPGKSVEETIADLRADLLAQGYVEE